MPALFHNPYPQFLDSTPEVRSGAKLFFYEAGTSTKLDTYPTLADAQAGTNANSNPIVLNSSGYPDVAIFLKNQAYKIILAPSTDTDPPVSAIWTIDNFWGTDFASVTETKVGSGSPTGNVAGTAGSAGVLPTLYWDYTNQILYFCTTTGAAAAAGWTAINASAATPSVPPPQGYLTLVSGTPAIQSDQASKTAVYYTPYTGNLIPIYNGASMVPTEFSELTLTLVAQHAANTIYDVFVWSESGVLTIGTGPAWSTSTAGSGARGTGASTTELARVKGIYVNAVAITARNSSTTYSVGANLATYVGSILIDGSAGQVTCHVSSGQARTWNVWNAYNRRPLTLRARDATSTWAYGTASFRASNNDANNKVTVLCGLPEEIVDVCFVQVATYSISSAGPTSLEFRNGIGVNSTSSATEATGKVLGTVNSGTVSLTFQETMDASLQSAPFLGINAYQALEYASANVTFQGGSFMQLTAQWRG